ncbi:MAG: MBOAT family protein [Lentisphaeria bacterium]|nr:MBOAT family protein [Lentisphaeria bacterium]
MMKAEKQKKLLLVAAILFNLGLLCYFKYSAFFMSNLGMDHAAIDYLKKLALPLGISFFTFQQLAFIFDAYKGIVKEHDFPRYMLFVTFFPQLIAGPIVHHKQMMPQFNSDKEPENFAANFSVGICTFILGLFKKVVIADALSIFVTELYGNIAAGGTPGFYLAWIGILAYTFQLYFDFSGYSDMALGIAKCFGIDLPINFLSPYKSKSIIEFWRRWHITLSTFLRDYLYIPLGGNRKGTYMRYQNLMITMLLGGLWHGAGWTFVIWGGLHGLYLMINHAWSKLNINPSGKFASTSLLIFYQALTFLAVMLAWVFFRSPDLETTMMILTSLVDINSVELTKFRKAPEVLYFAIIISFFMPNVFEFVKEKFSYTLDVPKGLVKSNRLTLGYNIIYMLFFVALVIGAIHGMVSSNKAEFLYYDF